MTKSMTRKLVNRDGETEKANVKRLTSVGELILKKFLQETRRCWNGGQVYKIKCVSIAVDASRS